MGFLTEPALGLVNEAKLVVVNANRAHCAFAEVKDFVARGWAFASDHGGLVVAIQVVFVSPVAEFHAFKQLLSDVRVAGGGKKGWEPIQSGDEAVLHTVGR